MATSTATSAGTAIFNRVLHEFQHELTKDEVDDFNFITADDLKKSVYQMQEEQKSKKRMQNLSRVSAFVEAMDQFDKVIQVFLNTTNYLGFVWGPAKFMLLVAGSYSDALNTLLDAYEEVGEHMPLLIQYEAMVSQSPSLQEILGLVYKDILTFHCKAMKHFRQRAWKQLFQATWRTFRTDFNAIISNLQSHRRLLDSQAIFIGVSQTMKSMTELYEIRRMLEEECTKRQEEEAKSRHLAVINWLCAADSVSDHEEAISVQENNADSGIWFFEQETIRDWIDQSPSAEPVLWINGRPGAGKTILASSLVEKCRHQHPSVVFFYCKHGDPDRNNFIGFARSIISQLSQLNPLLPAFIFEKQSTSGVDSLRSSKLAKELLAVAIETFDILKIVIDGLDECVKSQKEEISSWVRGSVASASAAEDGSKNLWCCILSQDDNDTGRLLKGFTTFTITEQHNNGDILNFCRRRANEIRDDFGLLPQDVQTLAECVSGNADGMFLYAKLVMDNLSGQVSKSALKKEMRSIPPNLNEVYKRIRHRIFVESSPGEQGVAKTLLSWLLCAKRPLKWHEIQGAMCLDRETGLFDEERRLIRDVKHFCGSLIEVRKGGAIYFVHLTAKLFLQESGALSEQFETLNLTSLCFLQLSLDSHGPGMTQDIIREYIFRGEFAFSDYAFVHVFDHLFDVLSSKEALSTTDYQQLRTVLRKFVSIHVNAPTKRAPADRSIDNRLEVFKEDGFVNDLRYAVKFHRESLVKTKEDVEIEPVLTLLAQLLQARAVLERMFTVPEPDYKLEDLYGQYPFKCSEPQCELFHGGFSTANDRDYHYDMHKRLYFCSFTGCQSSMIGFPSALNLKKHEDDYHQEMKDPASFPWNGTLETLDINKEIKEGNDVALDLWISDEKNRMCDTRKYSRRSEKVMNSRKVEQAMLTALRSGRHRMMEKLLSKFYGTGDSSRLGRLFNAALEIDDRNALALLLGYFTEWKGAAFPTIITTALKLQKDNIAIQVLSDPKSPTLNRSPAKGKSAASYLSLAIRYGRDAIVQYLLDNQQLDPKIVDDEGRTSLITAAEFDRPEIARYLIDNAACDKWAPNKSGNSPLHMAGRQGHEKFISRVFSDELSANSEEVRTWHRTAQLRNATILGDDQKVEKLLGGGFVHVDEVDKLHVSPWLWAVSKAHLKIVELFLARGDILFTRKVVFDQKYLGIHALHLAARAGSESLTRMLFKRAELWTTLLNVSMNIPRSGFEGQFYVSGTALEIARKLGHDGVAKIIEDYKASLAVYAQKALVQSARVEKPPTQTLWDKSFLINSPRPPTALPHDLLNVDNTEYTTFDNAFFGLNEGSGGDEEVMTSMLDWEAHESGA
ncbi:hypothetical protein BCR34DRAFT_128195 [Clohesyomyces aquaticus]|uniref:Uncharacterized protein n=1 Tax=Clohesyomyces aquaticus TaxID=1231657 RepID=A0A1Y2AA36_9PLEO|nr:hypothetical protein BCR34DRAFT_128195 [Clohesyomyces aquaticus]